MPGKKRGEKGVVSRVRHSLRRLTVFTEFGQVEVIGELTAVSAEGAVRTGAS